MNNSEFSNINVKFNKYTNYQVYIGFPESKFLETELDELDMFEHPESGEYIFNPKKHNKVYAMFKKYDDFFASRANERDEKESDTGDLIFKKCDFDFNVLPDLYENLCERLFVDLSFLSKLYNFDFDADVVNQPITKFKNNDNCTPYYVRKMGRKNWFLYHDFNADSD